MRLVLALGLLAVGCSSGSSSEDCSKALDHIIDLEIQHAGGTKGLTEELKADLVKQKAAVSEAQRAQFMEACTKKTPSTIVECALAADSIEKVGRCQ